MNTNKNIYITPEEYEKMQSTFNCKTEYDNGRIIMHSDTSIRHNDIVLNIESVTIINALTNSNLKIEEGKDEVQMCKALDDLIEDGRNEGRKEGIVALISICREFGIGDNEIITKIMEKFAITEEEATDMLVKDVCYIN